MGLQQLSHFSVFYSPSFFFVFSSFLFLAFIFSRFLFLRFSSFSSSLLSHSARTRPSNCKLLAKWGISLRPRLHRPRSEVAEFPSQVKEHEMELPLADETLPMQRSHHLFLDGPNHQSPIASVQRTRPTLAGHSAVQRGTNTTPMNANRAIRIAAQ